jgi:hypothetical protein
MTHGKKRFMTQDEQEAQDEQLFFDDDEVAKPEVAEAEVAKAELAEAEVAEPEVAKTKVVEAKMAEAMQKQFTKELLQIISFILKVNACAPSRAAVLPYVTFLYRFVLSVPSLWSMHVRHGILTCCPTTISFTSLYTVFRLNIPHMHVLGACDQLSIHTTRAQCPVHVCA